MHILFLSDNFPPEVNAVASRVYERARYWVEWGCEVTVITSAPNFPQGKVYPGYRNKWYQVEMMDGIRVVRVKTFMAENSGFAKRILDFLSYMVMAFLAGLWQRKPDRVVATSPQFFAAVGGWALAFCRRKPFVLELSDLWPASIASVGAMRRGRLFALLEKLELFLYRRARVIIAQTPAFKQDLVSRGIAADKIHVVLNGVEIRHFTPTIKDPHLLTELQLQQKFVVGYIGTQGMAHGLKNILDCAEQLKQQTTDGAERILFMLVGDGARRKFLQAEIKQRRLNNVLLIPPQPKQEIHRYWSVCDVALVHLKDDPVFATVIPSKMFEAMGMGLPVLLALPQGVASALVAENNVGVWVEPQNPTALADAVLKLMRDEHWREKLAAASVQAAPQFSREKQARSMLTILEQT